MIEYPNLVGEIAKRGIKRTEIAGRLNISGRCLANKMSGASSFTWEEVCRIKDSFFPDMDKDVLFARADQPRA